MLRAGEDLAYAALYDRLVAVAVWQRQAGGRAPGGTVDGAVMVKRWLPARQQPVDPALLELREEEPTTNAAQPTETHSTASTPVRRGFLAGPRLSERL